MDGGAWWAAVHGVAKSHTWLSDFTFTFHFYALEKEMATHSSVRAWRIPGMGSHRVRHDWSDLAIAAVRFYVCVLSRFSHVWLFATPWTIAHQAPLSMGFSRKENRSGLPCLLPRDVSKAGIELASPEAPALQADSLPQSHLGSPQDSILYCILLYLQRPQWLRPAPPAHLRLLFPRGRGSGPCCPNGVLTT